MNSVWTRRALTAFLLAVLVICGLLLYRLWMERVSPESVTGEALVALAHTVLVIVYHILTKGEPYRDLGAAYFDELDRERVERRLVSRLERLGYAVTLQPSPPASSAAD